MRKELLIWVGNVLNFLILIYIIISTLNTICFNMYQLLITAFGLLTSILIQLRSLIN